MLPKQHNSCSDTNKYIETHPLEFYNFRSKTSLDYIEKLAILLRAGHATKQYTIESDGGTPIKLDNLALTIPIDVPNIENTSESITSSLRTKWISDIKDGFKVDLELNVTTVCNKKVSKVFNIRVFPFSVQNFMLDLSFIPSKQSASSNLNFKTFIFLDRTLNRDTGKTSSLEHIPTQSTLQPHECINHITPQFSTNNTPPSSDDKSNNSENSIVVIDNQKKGNKISFVRRISKFLNIKGISVANKHKERNSQSFEKDNELNSMMSDVNGFVKMEQKENKKYQLINENYILKANYYTKQRKLVLLNQDNFELLFSLQNLLLQKSRVLLTLICNRTLYLSNILSNFRQKLNKYKNILSGITKSIKHHKTGKSNVIHQKLEEMHILRLRNKGYYKQNYNTTKKTIKTLNDCSFLKSGSGEELKKLDVLKTISERFNTLKENFIDFVTSSELLKNKQVTILESLKEEYMRNFDRVKKNETVINKYKKQEKKMKKMRKEITRNSKTNNNFCIFNSKLNGIKSQNRKREIADIILKLKKYYSNKLFINRFLDFYTEQLLDILEQNSPNK